MPLTEPEVAVEVAIVVFIFSLLLFAGLVVIWMGMHNRRLIREMEHRERLAMIERGLAPLDVGLPVEGAKPRPPMDEKAIRSRTAGIMIIGIGLAFAVLVSLAGGNPEAGVGVGGAAAMIGVAFFVNAMMLRHSTVSAPPSPPTLRRAEPRGPSSSSTPDL